MESKIDPRTLAALQAIATRKDEQGRTTREACYDAWYHDRDGKRYPAHIEDVNSAEPGHRVWCAADGLPQIFKLSDPDRGTESYYRLTHEGDGRQTQSRMEPGEALQAIGDLREYKCLLFTPPLNPFARPRENEEPCAGAFKVPVVDLLVDFGSPARPRINHIGHVRHRRHVATGPGFAKIPFYEEMAHEDVAAQSRSTN